MKFFVTCVSLCMTSIFYISEANEDFFILVHRKMSELHSGLKWIQTTYFTWWKDNPTKIICEKVKKAKIFIADRPMTYEPTSDNDIDGIRKYPESDFFLNETWDSETNEFEHRKLTAVELLFHDQKIKTTVIICEFSKSEKDKIYVARREGSQHYFLFGKTDESTLPSLLAIGMNYMRINTVQKNKYIENVIWQYLNHNDKATSHRVAKKLFEEDGIDIFLLCASIIFHEESEDDKKTKYKYIITIPGPENNLSMEVPIKNIVKFIPDNYTLKSIPLLPCRIKQKADNEYPIRFKFYIAPDVTVQYDSRIFAMYDYLNGSKVTQVNKHYVLSSPWTFSRKHPRS